MASDDAEKELLRTDVSAYLRRYQNKELLRFVAVGSVDDGKSTLIGRLLFDSGSVYADQLEAARKATQLAGTDLDLSLLTDGLAAEREQGITIDVAYRYFSTARRKFIIADTPGHVQYTRNMVTGASTANVAIILIDARLGVLQQSRRHAYLASLLGIPHLCVCVNKMDLVGFDPAVFARLRAELEAFTRGLGFTDVTFFPVSALAGDNCVHPSPRTPWYDGPTVLQFLETVPVHETRDLARLRYPVQVVLRPTLDYRGFAGRVASGVIRRGDPVMVLPSGKTSHVKAIDSADGELDVAFASQSVALRLEDEVDVSRGDMIVHPADAPRVTRTFDAHLVWMRDAPLDAAKSYLLKHTTRTVRVEVDRIHHRKDMDTLADVPATTLALNEIGRVTLTAHRALFVDPYTTSRETGSFILIDPLSNDTVAAGMILQDEGSTAGREEGGDETGSQVSERERRARLGASPALVLVVGGQPAAARELAYAVERQLFDRGAACLVLPAGGAGGLSAARAVVAAGGLAIAWTDVEGAEAVVDAGPVLRVDADAPGGAGAVVRALASRGWIA
jgi:bifunctional enzyme CysN/CysC/sulfate adenylyltransferase subunit 1